MLSLSLIRIIALDAHVTVLFPNSSFGRLPRRIRHPRGGSFRLVSVFPVGWYVGRRYPWQCQYGNASPLSGSTRCAALPGHRHDASGSVELWVSLGVILYPFVERRNVGPIDVFVCVCVCVDVCMSVHCVYTRECVCVRVRVRWRTNRISIFRS